MLWKVTESEELGFVRQVAALNLPSVPTWNDSENGKSGLTPLTQERMCEGWGWRGHSRPHYRSLLPA